MHRHTTTKKSMRPRLFSLLLLTTLTWSAHGRASIRPPPAQAQQAHTHTHTHQKEQQQQAKPPPAQKKGKQQNDGPIILIRPPTQGGATTTTTTPHIQTTSNLKAMLKKGQLEAARFDTEEGEQKSKSQSQSSTETQQTPQIQISRFALIRRGLYLLYLFSAAIATAFLAFVSERFRNPYWYRMITCAISRAGAAFIKWGQWASARPDIFPEDLCSTLAMLHSYAPTHSFAFTKKAVEEAFGAPIDVTFQSFEKEPVASGSIAQVHSAVLPNGRRVAVKVRHPGVAEQIEKDFRIMKKVAELVDSIPALKFLNLGHSMEQFSHTLASQTRLDVEGKHLMLLNHNFRRWKTLRFPEPLVLSEGVLVESWEEGVIISEFIARYSKWRELEAQGCEMCGRVFGAYTHLRLYIQDTLLLPVKPLLDGMAQRKREREMRRLEEEEAACYAEESAEEVEEAVSSLLSSNKKDCKKSTHTHTRRGPLSVELAHFIVSTGEDLYLKMLLVDNLMHADLHPGNILIHVGDNGRPILTLVDAGMVAKLTETERINFIGLLEAMGTGDGARAARHVLGFSVSQTCVGEDAEGFGREMQEVFAEHCRGYHTGVDIGIVLREVLAKVRKYHVRVDVNYATLLINLLCLEGLASALLPTYNILDRAKPLLAPHSKKILRPFFRKLYPILLTLKRSSESALFSLLKKTGNVQRPPQEEVGGKGKGKGKKGGREGEKRFLPADRHAHGTLEKKGHVH